MSAAYQPISLLEYYDGSSRTFGFPNHGWLAVVASGSRFYFTPSVPRFNPGVMIPKTGGGYRRYSQPYVILKGFTTPLFFRSVLTLSLSALSGCRSQMLRHIDSYGMVRGANPLYSTKGWKSH
ncbi:hypothetical protein AP9108_35975 [Arthrospira sp. PCC 9108]|nr:hypothetical protein AP9108_35975 [Arthrospira sp. PCC 9108]